MHDLLYHDDDEFIQVAMQIILESGEARKLLTQALDQLASFNFAGARESLQQANDHICKAHNAQTEKMQAEISQNKPFTPSILFNHAQDTLMTVMSELHLTEKNLVVFESLYRRITEKEDA